MADGRYWLSHDAKDVDDTIDEVVAARGSEASLSARLAEIVGDFEADQQRQETEIGVVAALGAKNAFNPADYIANSRVGVTITYNGDGTYRLSGTPTQTSDYLYTPDNVYNDLYGLQAGQTYKISTGVESSKVLVRIIPSYDGVSYDWSRPLVNNASVKATFTIPDDVVGLLIDFRSTANAGSLNGIVLKPMICRAEITDDTFVPYAPTNRELWQKINAIKRTYKVPISSTPINGLYFGVQMFPFEFDSVPDGNVEVQNIGQGGVAIDPTKFTCQITTWGFRIYTRDSTYAGLIPDVKISYAPPPAASLMQAGRLDAELTDAGRIDAADLTNAEPEEEADA